MTPKPASRPSLTEDLIALCKRHGIGGMATVFMIQRPGVVVMEACAVDKFGATEEQHAELAASLGPVYRQWCRENGFVKDLGSG